MQMPVTLSFTGRRNSFLLNSTFNGLNDSTSFLNEKKNETPSLLVIVEAFKVELKAKWSYKTNLHVRSPCQDLTIHGAG